MKIEAKDNQIILKKVFNSVKLETEDGETIYICMRDTGFEILYNDCWYEAKEGIFKKQSY